ncbi:hypothetical protein Tco_0050097 [Tanacetum coccineum]
MADLIENNLALEESLDKHGTRLYNLENLNIPYKVSQAVDEIVTDANKTGAPQGEELGLMKPLSESSCSCSDNSFILDGANRYGARATGVAPGIKSIWNSTGRA